VTVDGRRAALGLRIKGSERVCLDGNPLEIARSGSPPRVLLLHKPLDIVCTRHDPEGRPTVFSLLPAAAHERWVMVGRLDVNTSGLLLFTDWGELANRLMHPRYEVEREYAVRVYGTVDEESLELLCRGVESEGEKLAFDRLVPGAGAGMNRWYQCVLHMGRNRAVRRAFEAVGVQVSRLIRTRFGSVSLPRDLEPGEHRELTAAELAKLARQVGLEVPAAPIPRHRGRN
jgi:23S rRNA pseudouridine2605 synthase